MTAWVIVVLCVMGTVFSALVSLRYQGRKKHELEEAFKKACEKNRIEQRQAARADMEASMKEERQKLQDILGRFIKIIPRVDICAPSARYMVTVEFGREIILGVRHGDIEQFRYLAHMLSRKIERELATLNIERFQRAEVEQRERDALRFRSFVQGDPLL